MILNPNHLIFVSLDSLLHQLSVDSKIVKFPWIPIVGRGNESRRD